MPIISDVYENTQMEKELKKNFAFIDNIGKVIFRNVPVGKNLTATVFLSNKSILFLYINGTGEINLREAMSIAKKMNLTPELLFPPKEYPLYFEEYGAKEFRRRFPGKYLQSMDDIAYYRTLAPYSPALIQILRVEGGIIQTPTERINYPYSRARTF